MLYDVQVVLRVDADDESKAVAAIHGIMGSLSVPHGTYRVVEVETPTDWREFAAEIVCGDDEALRKRLPVYLQPPPQEDEPTPSP